MRRRLQRNLILKLLRPVRGIVRLKTRMTWLLIKRLVQELLAHHLHPQHQNRIYWQNGVWWCVEEREELLWGEREAFAGDLNHRRDVWLELGFMEYLCTISTWDWSCFLGENLQTGATLLVGGCFRERWLCSLGLERIALLLPWMLWRRFYRVL